MTPDRTNSPPVVDVGEVGAFDADQFHRLSAWAGHAGPKSSYPYMNQYEEPLLVLTRSARPAAWSGGPSAAALKHFADLAQDPIAPSRFATHVGTPPALVTRTSDVGVTARLELTIQIGRRRSDSVAAAHAYIDVGMAHQVLVEVHEAMEIARLGRRKARSPSAAIQAVRAYGAWTIAARAPKLIEVEKALDARVKARDIAALRSLFEAWRLVRSGEHLCMDDGYSASVFLKQLPGLGLDRKAMFIKSREGAPPLDRLVAAERLPVVSLASRPERVQHRLQFTEPDVNREEASGKQISSTGFHWLMVLATSWLRSTGDLNWS